MIIINEYHKQVVSHPAVQSVGSGFQILAQRPAIPIEDFHGFPQSIQANVRTVPQVRPWPFPFTLFSLFTIHPTFNAIQSELLMASLNKWTVNRQQYCIIIWKQIVFQAMIPWCLVGRYKNFGGRHCLHL
jgi:hypothetical protein